MITLPDVETVRLSITSPGLAMHLAVRLAGLEAMARANIIRIEEQEELDTLRALFIARGALARMMAEKPREVA